jgi:hypothetical protein
MLLSFNADINARDKEYRPRFFRMFSKHDKAILCFFLFLIFASHLLFNQ